MDFTTLQAWVKEGEHHTQEFKRSTSQLKPAMQTLCAFLNSQGGRVLIGVTDEGKIIGQQVADKTQREIGQLLQTFEPHATIDYHAIPLPSADTHVIVLEAKPQPGYQPYLFAGRAYERQQTTTHVMSQSRYEQLLFARNSQIGKWESQTAVSFILNDLDQEEIFRTLQLGIAKGRIPHSATTTSAEEALIELGLLEEDHLLQAAVVLFARNPALRYPQCVLSLACFNSTEKEHLVDTKRVHGNIFVLLDAAMAFVNLHLPIKSHFEGILRIDDYLFPEKVLREAFINAFAHRDYSVSGGSVSFMIYTDRVEITSFGGLLPPMTIEELKVRHPSLPRNRKIADTLYNRGMIDEHGSGTREIIRLTCEAGHPEPEFIETAGFFSVCLKSKEPIRPAIIKEKPIQLTPLQESLLMAIHTLGKKADLSTLEEKFQESLTKRQLRHELEKLKEIGAIKAIGRGKMARWILTQDEEQ